MDKKQLIMESAILLFTEQGFEQTSIQQITDKAGISKGAFYLSFKSKDELIISLIEYFINSLLLDIEQTVNSNETNKIGMYLHKLFTNFQKNAFFSKILLNEKMPNLHPIILDKIHQYYLIVTKDLYNILTQQYPKLSENMIPEMIFIIQSLTACYGKLFLHENRQVEINHLVINVLEKIDLLATQSNKAYITITDILVCEKMEITKEKLLMEMDKKLQTLNNQEFIETISLLKQEIIEPSYPKQVIQGLISLLKNNIDTVLIASLCKQYFNNEFSKGQK